MIRENLDAALDGERREFEIELPYSTLGRRWIHVVYEPLRRDGGIVTGIVAVLTDITQRQLAARELERARAEAVRMPPAPRTTFWPPFRTSFARP